MTSTPKNLLSCREVEVLQGILDGKSDADIGCLLGISAKTTNFHVENAKRKLGASQRIRAVAFALQAGLLRFPSDNAGDDADARRARPRIGSAPEGMPSFGSLGFC